MDQCYWMNALNPILHRHYIYMQIIAINMQSIQIRFNIWQLCKLLANKNGMPIRGALTFYKNETNLTKFYLDSFNSKNKQFKIKCISQEGFSLFDFMFKRFTVDIDSWLCTRYLCMYVRMYIFIWIGGWCRDGGL